LAAEDPGHQIELENAYKTPVDTADYGQNQGKNIDHNTTSIVVMAVAIMPCL
jgi:hypothetical protein